MKNYIQYFSHVIQKYFLAEMKMMNCYFCRSLLRERVNEHNIFAYDVRVKNIDAGIETREGETEGARARDVENTDPTIETE